MKLFAAVDNPVGVGEISTLSDLFQRRVALTPDAVAYRQYDTGAAGWREYTWRDMAARVVQWRVALVQEDLAVGDRVAVLVPNSVEWVCFEQAALATGLVVVPLFTADTVHNRVYMLGDAGAVLLLVASEKDWQPLSVHWADFPRLKRVLCLTVDDEARPDPLLRDVSQWLMAGQAEPFPHKASPEDLATIVYTSGTTGRPKGVMLSHQNLLSNVLALIEAVPGYTDDLFLSVLPLSHAFERVVGYYAPMMTGGCVAFVRSVDTLGEDLVQLRPTLLVGVPRLYERVYDRIHAQAAHKGRIAQRLLDHTIALGWRRFSAAQLHEPALSPGQRFVLSVLGFIVAKPILARFGGRLRIAVCGGAAISEEVSRFFLALGLPLLQGYGLTEAGPVVACNRIEDNQPSSVGKPLTGVETNVVDDGELLVRSSGVMLGYWRKAEATNEAVDADGWLHTGDLAELIDGYVYIRGRCKAIIVMATGEKAPSADIELALTLDPLIDQALVVGESRPFLAALLVLNKTAWQTFAAECGVDPDDSTVLQTSDIQGAVLEQLTIRMRGFPRHAQVRGVHLTLQPWTIEAGLVTPTAKPKRAAIEAKFAAEIDYLYRHRHRVEDRSSDHPSATETHG
jgi:long-chain acyl-CoA synthetase